MANYDNEPHLNDPNRWRQRAKEARDLAELIENPDAKQNMLRAAEHYEFLAKHAEEQLGAAIAEQQQTKPAATAP